MDWCRKEGLAPRELLVPGEGLVPEWAGGSAGEATGQPCMILSERRRRPN